MSSIKRKCSENGEHVRGEDQLFRFYYLLKSRRQITDFLVLRVSLILIETDLTSFLWYSDKLRQ